MFLGLNIGLSLGSCLAHHFVFFIHEFCISLFLQNFLLLLSLSTSSGTRIGLFPSLLSLSLPFLMSQSLLTSHLCHARARSIDTSTLVAERFLAATSHVVTAFRSLHPERAMGTLLELPGFHQFGKLCIQFLYIMGRLVLFA